MSAQPQTDLLPALEASVEQARGKKLRQKLLAIMGEVSYIQKDKRNEFHKYSYASEAAIKMQCHAALVKHGILFKVSQSSLQEREIVTSKGNKETVTTIHHVYEFIDVETGEREAGEFYGSGCDGADKGCYKATTGAIKYILTSMFLIPTGDDPEKDSKEEIAEKRKSQKKAQDAVRSEYDEQYGAPPPAEGKKSAGKPEVVPPPANAPQNWFKTVLNKFAEMKARIGEKEYYRVLGLNGYAHANEFPNREVALKIYKEMEMVDRQQQFDEQMSSSSA